MKKLIFIPLFVFTFFGIAYAATVTDTGTGGECMKTVDPIETTVCFFTTTTLTYNNPSPAGDILVSLDSHYIHDGSGVAWFGLLRCNGGPCASTNVMTAVNGWQTYYGGTGGSVTVNLTAGSYPITIDNTVWDASGSYGCQWAGASCVIMSTDPTSGGTLTVETPASVNLNIGQWFQKTLQNIIASFSPIEIATAQTRAVATTSPQVKAVLVANVNLTNAQLIRLSDDKYQITFALTNKSEEQSGVHYTFSFLDKNDRTVSTQIFDRNLTLPKNKPVFINEPLSVPEGLSGTYSVRIQAFTKEGLPLGTALPGKVTVTGKKVPTVTSCSLNRKTYEQNETLPVTCAIEGTASPDYIVTSSIFYGYEPAPKTKAIGEIEKGSSQTLLRGISTPGRYIIRSQVTKRDGTPVSKEVISTFTINGTSASILNLLLDKNRYEKGDTAQATLSTSVFTTQQNKLFKLRATLSNKRGLCAKEIQRELAGKTALELFFPVERACKNPNLTLTLSDERGVLLAEKSLSLVSDTKPLSQEAKAGIALLAIIAIIYTLSRKKVVKFLRKGI